jgi:hypothetical protein
MNLFGLSCKQTTGLIEKRILVKLSFKERMQLRLHKSRCIGCTNYEKQSRFLDKLLQKHIRGGGEGDMFYIINDELKNRILSRF